jgi:periplasmic protein TonB
MKPNRITNPFRPHKNAGKNLKDQYRLSMLVGLALSLSLTTTLFRLDLQDQNQGLKLVVTHQEVVQMDEIQQTDQIKKPPPPPRPPVPVAVPNDTILEDDILDLDASLDVDAALAELPPPPAPAVEKVEETEIFVVVEQMPEIIGGNKMVYQYLKYPDLARQAGMEGLVVVQIVVIETGEPSSPEIARSAGDVLDAAAVKAVMRLRFVPGRQRGRNVKVKLAIPIRFRLRDAIVS